MTLLASTTRALMHELAVVQSRDRQPSLVAGVVRDGELVWAEGYGGVDDVADTQNRIGSVTKTMTALLVLQCRDGGLLDLDEPVGSYLPDSPWPGTSLPPPWGPEPELAGADELLGHWYWGNHDWTLSVRAGQLTLDTGNPFRDSRFEPAGADTWRGLDAYFAGERLRVLRDDGGAVVGLDLATYALTRRPDGG